MSDTMKEYIAEAEKDLLQASQSSHYRKTKLEIWFAFP